MDWHPPEYYKNIEMRFGVELEICIRINPDCLQSSFTRDLYTIPFQERFHIYFDQFLSQAPIAIRKLYPEIAMKSDEYGEGGTLYYIYNLRNPLKKGAHGKKERNVRRATIDEKTNIVTNYPMPIFEQDTSVICGDVSHYEFQKNMVINRNTKRFITMNESIGIECISPILRFQGIPNSKLVEHTLHSYFQLIGLGKPQCFMTNKTTGFHVNVSAYDTIENTILPITKYPMFMYILQQYIAKEREYYRTEFRQDRTDWAKPVYAMYNQMLEKKPTLLNKPEKQYDILTSVSHPKTSLLHKEFGINIKENELLEFRVFQSDKRVDQLVFNTVISLTIVMNGILQFWDSIKKNDGSRSPKYTKKQRKQRKQKTDNQSTLRLRDLTKRRNEQWSP